MYSFFQQYVAYTILIAGLLVVLLFKKIHRTYYPFLCFILLGCASEVVARYSVLRIGNNAATYNLYVLAEGVLLTWLFRNLGLFRRSKAQFLLMLVLFTAVWLAEMWLRGSLDIRFNYYRVLYSIAIVMMSIYAFNRLLTRSTGNGAVILLLISFTVYFSFKILIEIFATYGLSRSVSFQVSLYQIMRVVNFCVNLAYIVAVVLISGSKGVAKKPVLSNNNPL